MRHPAKFVLWLLCAAVPAQAQFSAQVNIGVDIPAFPQLTLVPGYPVYYAPDVDSNYFFYDGMYWLYADDYWYSSYWYDGPWDLVEPEFVPLYVLRVPVQYYRRPPPYFRSWQRDAPPRWDEHWGNQWAQRHRGWDRWQPNAAPRPAPLPTYQRQFSRDHYPDARQQQDLRNRNYQYQPRDPAVRQRDDRGERRGRVDDDNNQRELPRANHGPLPAPAARPNELPGNNRLNEDRPSDRPNNDRPNFNRSNPNQSGNQPGGDRSPNRPDRSEFNQRPVQPQSSPQQAPSLQRRGPDVERRPEVQRGDAPNNPSVNRPAPRPQTLPPQPQPSPPQPAPRQQPITQHSQPAPRNDHPPPAPNNPPAQKPPGDARKPGNQRDDHG